MLGYQARTKSVDEPAGEAWLLGDTDSTDGGREGKAVRSLANDEHKPRCKAWPGHRK